MTARHTLVLFSFLALAFPAVASADVIPPDVEACTGETVGSACMDTEGMGICAMSTCSRLDYEHWDRDASPNSPPSIEYDCTRCIVGGPTDAGPSASDGGHVDMTAPPHNCSASPARTGGLVWLVGLGLAVVARRRRG